MKISEYKDKPARRNPVAKHQHNKTGAGQHPDKKNDYKRKPKHKKSFRDE